MILSLCIPKSPLFLNLFIFTYVTFGVYVALSPLKACHHIVRGLFLSRPPVLTINFLLFGEREAGLTRLQRLQNKAARLVISCGRDQSSSDLLRELHWLPVKQRIIYKLMLYIYKALNDMAPCYISAMTHLQNTDPAEYRQRLRSDQTRLIVSRSFKRAGDMSFTVAAASLWNDFPVYLRESQSFRMFKAENWLVSIIFVVCFSIFFFCKALRSS